MQLNKQNILSLSDGGLDFYKHVIADLKPQGAHCSNVRNPFYPDTNPSLSIFLKNDKWLFKDFGNENYSGDVFAFAAHHYQCSVQTQFSDILRNINRDLVLNLAEKTEISVRPDIEKRLYHIRQTPKKQAADYLKQRGITRSNAFFQSKAYKQFPAGIVFVNHNETGCETRFVQVETQTERAFQPKTKFHGTKSGTIYSGGYSHESDAVFICEGAINALSFAEIGYSAIATFGATNLPTLDILMPYIKNKKVYLAGDGDTAGERFNETLYEIISSDINAVKSLFTLSFPTGTDANDILRSGNLKRFETLISTQKNEETDISETDERMFDTPTIPNLVYENLPEMLKQCVAMFEERIERDVFLVGALGVIGGCLPNVRGIYFNKPYSAHLFTLVVAPAGSGKGTMEWAKYLGQTIHENIVDESKRQRADYETDTEYYNSQPRKDKINTPKPTEPPFKVFYIPANSSASSFIQTLNDNDFQGVIFETEADTLANSFKQEWGNFSDILRKAFHHENTNMKRRSGNEYIEIKHPQIAIVMSGTPNQVRNLIHEVENGLLSRFMFYAFESETDFKNPFVSYGNADYPAFFQQKGQEINDLYQILSASPETIMFRFTPKQENEFTQIFNEMLKRDKLLLGNDFTANVKRLGVMTFRIAMILTTLRILEDGNMESPLVCSEIDFKNAVEIAKTLEKHAIAIFKRLPKNDKSDKNNKRLQFFEALPDEFDRAGYLTVAENDNITSKTAERYISQFKQAGMLGHKHNYYVKNKTPP